MNEQPLSTDSDAAATWVARMDADDWSERDEAELEQWLREDPAREGALLRAQALWLALDPREEACHVANIDEPPRAKAWAFSRRWVIAGGVAALAASVALVVLPNGNQVYETQVGEIRQVPLADGSSAAINTGSKIALDLRPNLRLVQLDRGEAWFKVAKNEERPFVVQAGNVWIRAVGTAFSVRRREGGADVLVTEGVVSAWSDRNEQQKIVVRAGNRAFVSSDAHIVQPSADAASIDRQLAWRVGKIDLVNVSLAEAVAEFNRYNERKIVLLDDAVAAELIDGVFRTDDPEGFAVAVHNLLGVPIDRDNPRMIRLGRREKNTPSI